MMLNVMFRNEFYTDATQETVFDLSIISNDTNNYIDTPLSQNYLFALRGKK